VPDPADEAARDLMRAREDARADLMRARHRLSKLLLRHGVGYDKGRAWTGLHDAWLRRQRLQHPGARAAFEDYYSLRPACAAMASMSRSPSSPPTRALRRWSGAWAACAGSGR
jgi:hypothetical protein